MDTRKHIYFFIELFEEKISHDFDSIRLIWRGMGAAFVSADGKGGKDARKAKSLGLLLHIPLTFWRGRVRNTDSIRILIRNPGFHPS
jgi:hypothetical protein